MKTTAKHILLGAIFFIGSAYGQRPVGQLTVDELVGELRDSNRDSAVSALVKLTETPEIAFSNLSILLATAEVSVGEIESSLRFGLFSKNPFWSGFHSKGAIIMGRVADVIRFSDDEANHTIAVDEIALLAKRAINGEVPSIAPIEALLAYYHTTFDPESNVSPSSGNLAGAVVSFLEDCASRHKGRQIGETATLLLARSAYLQPDRRKEILGKLVSVSDSSVYDEAKGLTERLVRQEGEPVSYNRYREILSLDTNNLLDFVIRGEVGGAMWKAYWNLLADRASCLPDGGEIALAVIADQKIRARYLMVPNPIPENASASDIRTFDTVFSFVEQEILQSGATDRTWAISALQWMALGGKTPAIDSVDRLRMTSSVRPYACDRIVELLGLALLADDSKLREMAASALGNIAWVSADVAQAARNALVAYKRSVVSNAIGTPQLSEPGIAMAMIESATQKAEQAVNFFDDSSVKMESKVTTYTDSIPPPNPSSRAGFPFVAIGASSSLRVEAQGNIESLADVQVSARDNVGNGSLFQVKRSALYWVMVMVTTFGIGGFGFS